LYFRRINIESHSAILAPIGLILLEKPEKDIHPVRSTESRLSQEKRKPLGTGIPNGLMIRMAQQPVFTEEKCHGASI